MLKITTSIRKVIVNHCQWPFSINRLTDSCIYLGGVVSLM